MDKEAQYWLMYHREPPVYTKEDEDAITEITLAIKGMTQGEKTSFLEGRKHRMEFSNYRAYKSLSLLQWIGEQIEQLKFQKEQEQLQQDMKNWRSIPCELTGMYVPLSDEAEKIVHEIEEIIVSLSTVKKIAYLEGVKTNFAQSDNPDISSNESVHKWICKELDRLNSILPLEPISFLDEEKSNQEFTTRRQVLALYHLLNYCRVDLAMVNKTDLARFTQFLTGKEANNPKIENTNIYKIWKDIYGKTEKGNTQDLQYIKGFFDKMGLSEVSKMIANDMKS